jgi:hypothetical protein
LPKSPVEFTIQPVGLILGGYMANKTYHARGKKIDGYNVRRHPNYWVWVSMKQRCANDKTKSYVNYGNRGISYHHAWERFEGFCKDMGLRPSPHHSLERVDNSKGYLPSNCIWADRFAQAANRRTFKNNTSGVRGVSKAKSGRFIARCQIEKNRYKLAGTFNTTKDAQKAILNFYELYHSGDIEKAKELTQQKARFDSKVGVRGISKHEDGGYIVRVTKDKNRIYLGYFSDLESATQELERWKLDNK